MLCPTCGQPQLTERPHYHGSRSTPTPEAVLALNRMERGRDLTDTEISDYLANRQTAIRHGTADIGTEIAEKLRDRLAAHPGAWTGWTPPWVTPEPPDSGDGAALHSCETCAQHDESLDEAYRKGQRDAGIDAALLVGCPGCGKIVRRDDTRAGQHRPSIHRVAAPAEAREEGQTACPLCTVGIAQQEPDLHLTNDCGCDCHRVERPGPAIDAVLAYRAAPPEYPGLTLVPTEALERLQRARERHRWPTREEAEEIMARARDASPLPGVAAPAEAREEGR